MQYVRPPSPTEVQPIEGPPSRLRRLISDGAALAVGAVVACLVLETLLRFAGYGAATTLAYGRQNYHPDLPELGFAGRPNLIGIQTREGVSDIRFNAHGFHDTEHSRQKPPESFRIAVIGNSYTMANQVALEDGYVAQMNAALASCPALKGRAVETINLGVEGYTIHQEFLMLRDYGMTLEPDLVVLQVNTFTLPGDLDPNATQSPRLIDDGAGGLKAIDDFRNSPGFKWRASWTAQALLWVSDRSRLIQYAMEAVKAVREPAPAAKPSAAPDAEAMARYRSDRDLVFGRMAALARDKGVPLALAVVPNADRATVDVMTPEPLRQAWHELAAANGVPVIDPDPEARQAIRTANADLHGFGAATGTGHLNRFGNRVFGEALAAKVCGLLERSK